MPHLAEISDVESEAASASGGGTGGGTDASADMNISADDDLSSNTKRHSRGNTWLVYTSDDADERRPRTLGCPS